jgi:hypothetical protein
MGQNWKHSNEVRQGVWHGLQQGRNYLHGRGGECRLGFDRAERMLATGQAGSHEACLDLYIDVLDKLSAPRCTARVASAENHGGYARSVARNHVKDAIRSDAIRRGGIGKPRQMRGPRLAVSRALGDPWLDELASGMLEVASSARNPAEGWPYAMFAQEKAHFLCSAEQPAGDIEADVARVERVMAGVAPEWYWRVVHGPRFAWQAEHPASLDTGREVDHHVVPADDDEPRLALQAAFAMHLTDPRIADITGAVEAACLDLAQVVPANRRLVAAAGAHMLADLIGHVGVRHLSDEQILTLVRRRLGAVVVAKLDAHAIRNLRDACKA